MAVFAMASVLWRYPLPEQLQIQRTIERLPGALRLPKRFSEALQNLMFRRVLVVVFGSQLRMYFANSDGLIDVQLLLNRKMKSEVQKRVDVARFRPPVGRYKGRWILQYAVILRM